MDVVEQFPYSYSAWIGYRNNRHNSVLIRNVEKIQVNITNQPYNYHFGSHVFSP